MKCTWMQFLMLAVTLVHIVCDRDVEGAIFMVGLAVTLHIDRRIQDSTTNTKERK